MIAAGREAAQGKGGIMAGPEERLKSSGRHVAIVGAFSVAGDDNDRVKTVTFEEATQAVKFGLRAQRVERTINGIHPFMSLEISTPAEEVEGVSTALPISGTALESELLKVEGSPDPAEIGGKIVVDLMDRLDEQATFWDPNFDVLLTEAYYFSRMFRKGRGEMVGGVSGIPAGARRRSRDHPRSGQGRFPRRRVPIRDGWGRPDQASRRSARSSARPACVVKSGHKR
jgi:hypothetical protein